METLFSYLAATFSGPNLGKNLIALAALGFGLYMSWRFLRILSKAIKFERCQDTDTQTPAADMAAAQTQPSEEDAENGDEQGEFDEKEIGGWKLLLAFLFLVSLVALLTIVPIAYGVLTLAGIEQKVFGPLFAWLSPAKTYLFALFEIFIGVFGLTDARSALREKKIEFVVEYERVTQPIAYWTSTLILAVFSIAIIVEGFRDLFA